MVVPHVDGIIRTAIIRGYRIVSHLFAVRSELVPALRKVSVDVARSRLVCSSPVVVKNFSTVKKFLNDR